jgi:serine/threonine protein kinase
VTPNRKLVFQATSEKQRDEWVGALSWLMAQSSVVGAPSNVVHVTHVDRNFQWTGKNLQETFKLVEKLGEGSFGVVYRAVHNEAKIEVAVKFVKFSSSDEESAKALRKEIAILRSCSNENVVEYLGCWGPDSRKRLWIITEFCHLGSITDCINVAKFKLNEAQIATIIASILRGLVYLHNRKIVHRDIKARNILLTKEGVVKLADFGLAKDLEGSVSQSTNAVGSPLHMAPEVIKGGGPNYKSDIWSTGITAIELAEGKPPHWEKNAYQVLAVIPNADPPRLQSDTWSKEFRDFVAQCCVKDPDQRPSSVFLLRHPFVSQVVSNEALNSLVEAYYANKIVKNDADKPPETIPEYQDHSEAKVVKSEDSEEKKSASKFEARLLQAIEDLGGSDDTFDEAESLSIGSEDEIEKKDPKDAKKGKKPDEKKNKETKDGEKKDSEEKQESAKGKPKPILGASPNPKKSVEIETYVSTHPIGPAAPALASPRPTSESGDDDFPEDAKSTSKARTDSIDFPEVGSGYTADRKHAGVGCGPGCVIM